MRIGSRTADPPFDWEDRSTWAAALEGTSAAYVSFYPDLGGRRLEPRSIAAFAAAALAAGTRRLVLLSGRGEEEAQRAESALKASGAEWTIVRCSWFCQNFDESFFAEPLAYGELALPAGDVGEPFVDVEDIADVAVAALTEDGHAGRLYELTGPRLLTFAEAVQEIARACGRPIAYTQISMEEFMTGLAEQEVPSDVAGLLAYLFGEVMDGRNAYLADGVRQALGRAPRDFADFARDAAAGGAWSATPQAA